MQYNYILKLQACSRHHCCHAVLITMVKAWLARGGLECLQRHKRRAMSSPANTTKPSGRILMLNSIGTAAEPGECFHTLLTTAAYQQCILLSTAGISVMQLHACPTMVPTVVRQNEQNTRLHMLTLSLPSCTPLRCEACNTTGSAPHHTCVVRLPRAARVLLLLCNRSCIMCSVGGGFQHITPEYS